MGRRCETSPIVGNRTRNLSLQKRCTNHLHHRQHLTTNLADNFVKLTRQKEKKIAYLTYAKCQSYAAPSFESNALNDSFPDTRVPGIAAKEGYVAVRTPRAVVWRRWCITHKACACERRITCQKARSMVSIEQYFSFSKECADIGAFLRHGTVIAETFVRNLSLCISYFWLKVRNLAPNENHTRLQEFATPPSLYENW